MAPVNDSFANAIELVGLIGSLATSNVAATREVGEPHTVLLSKTIWYKWTAPKNMAIRFNTFGSGIDTTLGVYTGAAVNALVEIAFNDDSPDNSQSLVLCEVVGGVTYHIQVSGFGGQSGDLILNWIGLNPLPVLPYDWPVKHPNNFYHQDFGATYASEADWRASLRPDVFDPVTDTEIQESETGAGGTFDAIRQLNGRSSLKMTDANTAQFIISTHGVYLNRAWHKMLIWLDPSVNPNGAYEAAFQNLAGFTGSVNVNWGYLVNERLAVNPLGPNKFEVWDIDSPDPAGELYPPRPYVEIKGRWIAVIALAEDDGVVPPRLRVWDDRGRLIADGSALLPSGFPVGWNEFDNTIQPWMAGADGGVHFMSVGLLEVIDGGTQARQVNPYCGLEGFDPCPGPPRIGWGLTAGKV